MSCSERNAPQNVSHKLGQSLNIVIMQWLVSAKATPASLYLFQPRLRFFYASVFQDLLQWLRRLVSRQGGQGHCMLRLESTVAGQMWHGRCHTEICSDAVLHNSIAHIQHQAVHLLKL